MDADDVVKTEKLTDCNNTAAVSSCDLEMLPPVMMMWPRLCATLCKRAVSRGKDLGHLTTSTVYNHLHYKHCNEASICSTQGSRRSQTNPPPAHLLPLAPPDLPNDPMSQTITETWWDEYRQLIQSTLQQKSCNTSVTLLKGANYDPTQIYCGVHWHQQHLQYCESHVRQWLWAQ